MFAVAAMLVAAFLSVAEGVGTDAPRWQGVTVLR
jgi:hypothetical protein